MPDNFSDKNMTNGFGLYAIARLKSFFGRGKTMPCLRLGHLDYCGNDPDAELRYFIVKPLIQRWVFLRMIRIEPKLIFEIQGAVGSFSIFWRK
jgi:hypothetical protein